MDANDWNRRIQDDGERADAERHWRTSHGLAPTPGSPWRQPPPLTKEAAAARDKVLAGLGDWHGEQEADEA